MNIVQKLFCISFMLCFCWSFLLGQEPENLPLYGELILRPNPPVQVPGNNEFVFNPMVRYIYANGDSEIMDLNDSVRFFWYFSDGTYSLERNPTRQLFHTHNNTEELSLKSSGRYKDDDPIELSIPSTAGISLPTQRPFVNILNPKEDLHLEKSWEPSKNDTLYYIITLENDIFEYMEKEEDCRQPISGEVTFYYPSNKLTIIGEIIHNAEFTLESNNGNNNQRKYSFSNLRYQNEQRYLVIIAKGDDSLSIGETFNVRASMEAGIPDSVRIRCSRSETTDDLLNTVTNPPKDPNNKVVSHETIYDGQGKQELLYTINFQNIEGKDAHKVRIVDYFNFEELDTSEFVIVAQSHHFKKEWINNRIRFVFEDIKLPSMKSISQSNSTNTAPNYNSTKGFISYRITVKEPSQVGDIIKTQARIEFYDDQSLVIPADTLWTEQTETTVKALYCQTAYSVDSKKSTCFYPIIFILSIIILLLLILLFFKKMR